MGSLTGTGVLVTASMTPSPWVRDAVRPSSHPAVLCGSAVTTMQALLSASAPLRGRAFLEMFVRPFGYREAADFWGVAHDPELAFRLHALVGGTPAYREMSGGPP